MQLDYWKFNYARALEKFIDRCERLIEEREKNDESMVFFTLDSLIPNVSFN